MKYLIFILLLSGCAKSSSSGPTESLSSIEAQCTIQSEKPAPQYGAGIQIATYYCNQFRPACIFTAVLGEPYNEVPGVLTSTCPEVVPTNQVPQGVQE